MARRRVPVEQPEPVRADEPLRWFRVGAACPTPLRTNPLVIEARNGVDARHRFFDHNGISATEHEVRAEPLEGEDLAAHLATLAPAEAPAEGG